MTTLLDFYLSEMTVSDFHGGGITLQRILGDDLQKIGRYIHMSQPTSEFPPIVPLTTKSSYIDRTFFERDATRSLIGCRPSQFLYNMTRPARTATWASRISSALNGSRVATALVCPQGTEAVSTLEKLKQLREVRYVTWLMDDHAAQWHDGHWRYPVGFRSAFAKHLREASTIFAISPALADFYKHEFGVECEILHGPADLNGPPVYDTPLRDGMLTLGYFGRIWKWQLDPLIAIARNLDPTKERLHIYGNDTELPPRLRLPAVQLKGPLPKERVIQVMRDFDAVVVPASFLEVERNLTELNIATKMSECLASGTVTIVCGPDYAAMVRYLKGTGAAHCLTDPTPEAWRAVAAATREAASRRRMLDAAVQLVQRELSTSVMYARWRSAVEKITQ